MATNYNLDKRPPDSLKRRVEKPTGQWPRLALASFLFFGVILPNKVTGDLFIQHLCCSASHCKEINDVVWWHSAGIANLVYFSVT